MAAPSQPSVACAFIRQTWKTILFCAGCRVHAGWQDRGRILNFDALEPGYKKMGVIGLFDDAQHQYEHRVLRIDGVQINALLRSSALHHLHGTSPNS